MSKIHQNDPLLANLNHMKIFTSAYISNISSIVDDVRNVSQIITVKQLRLCYEDIIDETTEIFRTLQIGRQFIHTT